MKSEIEALLAQTEGVVDQLAFEALGKMTWEQLVKQVERDTASGRMPAMGARHHAFLAKFAIERGDEALAVRHLGIAQRKWIEAQAANVDPRKMTRLTKMPEKPGARSSEAPELLYGHTVELMAKGFTKMKALRNAVEADPYLKERYRNASDDTLKKAFARAEKKCWGHDSDDGFLSPDAVG